MVEQTHDLTLTAETVTKVFRSWTNDEPDREWATLQLLAERAPGLAPAPLDRTELDGRPAIVMSRLPGTSLGGAPLTGAQTAAVGRALRSLHAVALPDSWPERVHGRSAFRTEVVQELGRETELTACADPPLVQEAFAAGRAWLARTSGDAGPTPVLGAADGNLANLLWDGERCRVVDFEDAGRSSRAYELADTVEHVSFRLAGRGDPEALAGSAGLPDDQRSAWTADRRLFACFWLAMLRPGGRGASRNPPGSAEDQARHLLDLLADPPSPRG